MRPSSPTDLSRMVEHTVWAHVFHGRFDDCGMHTKGVRAQKPH
ncbi:MAG: hypothetical protein R3C00_07745 [Hyphomonas sp.]